MKSRANLSSLDGRTDTHTPITFGEFFKETVLMFMTDRVAYLSAHDVTTAY